jgi:hypothetical protein
MANLEGLLGGQSGLGTGINNLAQNKLQSLLSGGNNLPGIGSAFFQPRPNAGARLVEETIQNLLGGVQQEQPQEQPMREGPKKEVKKLSKEERIAQREADKSTQKYYESILHGGESARQSDARLDRMERLVKKGNLPFSAYYNLLKSLEENITPAAGAGLGGVLGGALGGALRGAATGGLGGAAIGAGVGGVISPVVNLLRSIQKSASGPDLEEFEKLSAEFIKDAKGIFGSRITDADLSAFMKTVPTLSQTDAGKLRIIKNLKSFNKAASLRADALKKIIKENDGHRPADIELQVEERIKPQLDKISKEFVAD